VSGETRLFWSLAVGFKLYYTSKNLHMTATGLYCEEFGVVAGDGVVGSPAWLIDDPDDDVGWER